MRAPAFQTVMADVVYDLLIGEGYVALPFSGNLTLFVVQVITYSAGTSRFQSPRGDKLAHMGWIAPGVLLDIEGLEAGGYLGDAVWIEHTYHEHYWPAPGPYATHIAWELGPDAAIALYVLST